jgi:hypothetical protein
MLSNPGAPLRAQPATHALTNRSAIAARNLMLSRDAMLRLPGNGTRPLTVYSLDPSRHLVTTNQFDPRAARPPVSFNQNQLHIISSDQPGSTNAARLTKGRITLPSRIGIAREGANNDLTLNVGELFLVASESPLRWDAQKRAYATALDIGLDFDPASHITALPGPVAFELLTRNASVDRPNVTITRAGPPYERVTLTCQNARPDASVTAHNPHIPDKPLTIECARELGKLTVEPVTKKIFGYGLGTTKIRVHRLAKDDFDFPDPSALTVTLATSTGKLNPMGSVTIGANQSVVEAELRSIGIGTADITARFGPLSSTEHVTFAFPATFLLAALLGGCAGGAGSIFRHRARKPSTWRKWILEGCIVGLIIVAAAAGGIVVFNLPTAVLGTELGAFLLAAFSGYLGAPVLDRLVPQPLKPAD